ncbi:MAG: hypothetical protein QXG41_08510 [Candidatus Caldarchaeum sp.]
MLSAVLLSVFLMLSALTPYAQDSMLKLRVEPLTVAGDLYSVDVLGDAVVAVGKSGQMVVWSPRGMEILHAATTDLFSVSCGKNACVAVGKGGVVVEVQPAMGSYRSFKPSSKDLTAVSMAGDVAAILAGSEILVYRVGGHVVRTIETNTKLSSIVFDGRSVLTASSGKILTADTHTGEVRQLAAYKLNVRKAYIAASSIYSLTDRGVAKDGNMTLTGAFKDMIPAGRGFYLVHGQSVSLYDIYDGGLTPVAVLPNDINSIAAYGDGVVVAGPSGFLALVKQGGIGMMTAPQADYTAAVSDGAGGAVIAARNGFLMRYVDGVFYRHLIGDQPRSITLAAGEVVVLGGKSLWVFDRNTGEIKPLEASIRASDFNDLSPSPTHWLMLVGLSGRMAGVERDGSVTPVKATSSHLYAVASGYAVGDKVAVMLGSEPKVSKQDSKLVDVASTACGAVAVSDSGQIVYLKPDSITKASAGKLKLTTVSINPRGAYVLAGGAKGELILFDGLNATVLPTALPEEVRAIAWIDDRTAILVTSKAVYRLVEEWYPQPTVEVKAPKSVEVFAGASKRIELEIKPVNGFSGEVEIPVTVSGMAQYVSAAPQTLKLNLNPLCPAKSTLTISAYGEAGEGGATVNLWFKGMATSIQVAVKKPLQQTAQTFDIPLPYLIGVAVVVGIAVGVSSILRRRKVKQ